ncbi:hypothetical protein R3P38DRAFT_3306140 [Favolaschia claudopus]|uniref:Uncharacterized protein n=1 Tax=Favolaschia claudopus TaxID=2862362 RepID=A0AAW0DLE4_9AGAR
MVSLKSQLLAVDDLLLGSIGASIPPSETRDHATSQYACKLIAPFLLYRAQLQFRSGKRAQPLSPSTHALYKFAGSVSVARRIMGFWGILGIMKSLSALERSPPASRIALNLGRLQGLSMLVFYPLEYISFFSAPFGGPILRISPIVELYYEWTGLIHKESEATEDTLKAIKKRKQAILYQLFANVSRFPVILHWSTVGGIYSSELWTSGLSLLSGIAAFRGGRESSRIPAPMK